MTRTSWPARDQRTANRTDLRILLSRGRSIRAASSELGIPLATAYRWAGGARGVEAIQ